jgi:hypothetical protein
VVPRRLCDAVGLRPAPGFSVTGTTERRRSQSLQSTSIAQVASPVEAGPVPTLGRGAILAIDSPPAIPIAPLQSRAGPADAP